MSITREELREQISKEIRERKALEVGIKESMVLREYWNFTVWVLAEILLELRLMNQRHD